MTDDQVDEIIRQVKEIDPGPAPRLPGPDYLEITEEELRHILENFW